jgi:hypothetical protein
MQEELADWVNPSSVDTMAEEECSRAQVPDPGWRKGRENKGN